MYRERVAGWLTEDDDGYAFTYDADYLRSGGAEPVSLTLPLTAEPYKSNVLFPFFDGVNPNDRMGLLMACCKDCIGAVGVVEVISEK